MSILKIIEVLLLKLIIQNAIKDENHAN